MQRACRRSFGIDHDFDICGCNLYTVHQRVAKKFRVGRVVLAGDSAHVNSPIGGMGLNSGVHDAFNLADKLALIVRGEAEEAELDSYERQRRHVAVKHTQAQTIRNKRMLEERDPAVASATTTSCGARPRIRCWHANSCCGPRCSKACGSRTIA